MIFSEVVEVTEGYTTNNFEEVFDESGYEDEVLVSTEGHQECGEVHQVEEVQEVFSSPEAVIEEEEKGEEVTEEVPHVERIPHEVQEVLPTEKVPIQEDQNLPVDVQVEVALEQDSATVQQILEVIQEILTQEETHLPQEQQQQLQEQE